MTWVIVGLVPEKEHLERISPRRMSASLVSVATCSALMCFAANSLLCRTALRNGAIDAQNFTLIRILSGALLLALLAVKQGGLAALRAGDWRGAVALLGYAYCFSYSYLRLDAGLGALVLFGTVQATMVGMSIAGRSRPARIEWIGLGLALCGLASLTLPGKSAPDFKSALIMAMAGVSWGAYSLLPKGGKPALYCTAGNFLLAAPASILLFLAGGTSGELTGRGVLLAVISGAITSGLGYSLWYAVVPRLGSVRAAVVQLSVPVIAMVAATLLLGERYSARAIAAALVTIGGVGLTLFASWKR